MDKITSNVPYCIFKLFCSLLFIIHISIDKIDAQVTLTLDYKLKTGESSTVPSGKYWTMQLDYAVSSTTGSASGVKIEVAMPDYVNNVTGFVGTVHAPAATNFVWSGTTGAKKLTINFIDPVAAGSTGTLEFQLRTTNGATPNGTVIQTCATMTGTGATPQQKCHDETITAQPVFCGFKALTGGGAIDNPTTYRISMGFEKGYPLYPPYGALNLTNISLTDTYPAGAEIVEVKLNGNTVSYNTSGNTITVAIPNITINTGGNITGNWAGSSAPYVDITLKYNSGTDFTSGQLVTNSAAITFTPLGGSATTISNGSSSGGCTSELDVTHSLVAPTATATLTKAGTYGSAAIIHPQEPTPYIIEFKNTGNIPLENVEIIETVPTDQLTVSNDGYSGYSIFFDAGQSNVSSIAYQTNLNTNWINWPINGFGTHIPTLNTGEYITKIKVLLKSPFVANATIKFYMGFKGNATTASQVINNCVEWNSSTAGIPTNRTVCNTSKTLEPTPTTAKIVYLINNTPGCSGDFALNQVLTFTGKLKAILGYADLQNPTVAMFFPDGFEYVVGSETFEPQMSGITAIPTLTVTPNFGGSGKILYRWTFPSGTVLPAGKEILFTVNMKLGPKLVAGQNYANNTWFFVEGDNISIRDPNTLYPDIITDQYDWDADGNTTETQPAAKTGDESCGLVVSASASMESIKWVKGLCDTEYSKFPNYGQTVPGGNADYKLIVKNTGNVTMKDIKIIDILPFIGDKGVIDLSQRSTAWTPNLADPIDAPTSITVYYSTSSNPCRDEVKGTNPSPFPTGCETANWTTSPPANITTVKSVKIDFGTTTLAGGDSLIFSWPMRAPITAPTNNEIAWNSFAFVATRTDNNQSLLAAEPNKVGIKVKPGAPAYYGNRVWYDTNHDGIQDTNEGGVDGVKVKLFKVPSLNAIQNPATDQLINFTITGNGGYYKFSNLEAGFYYAVFCVPEEFQISPKNTGSTINDSDGAPTIYNAKQATITAVTELVKTEDDDSWDQGIFCSLVPSVSSNAPVPIGGTLIMTATGGNVYEWSGPNGWSSTGNMVTRTNMTEADAGNYIVNVYEKADKSGCWANIPISVLVGNVCSISLTSTPSICNNTSNQYTLSGNLNFINAPSSGSLTVSVNGGGSQVFNAPFTSPLAYTISGLISDGLSHTVSAVFSEEPNCTASAIYTANNPPIATCTPTQPTCTTPYGGSLSSSVTGGISPFTYKWSNGATASTISNLGAGTYTVTVTDNNNCTASCTAVLNPPSGCCEINTIGLVIGNCNNKGTLTNANDDEYTFTLNPTGNGLGTTYTVSGLPNSPQTGTYGSPTIFGSYLISTGVLNITVVDDVSNTCSKIAIVTPPPSCSVCNIAPPVLTITNNICPSRTGSINLVQDCGVGSFIQYSINNGNTWSSVKPLYSTTPRTIFARCVNSQDTVCKSTYISITTAPKNCPPDPKEACNLSANVIIDPCNNNATEEKALDDYFTIQVNASVSNGGTSNKYEVVNGADLMSGIGGNILNSSGSEYGTVQILGQNRIFKADGITSYQLIVRDINNNNCFQIINLNPVLPCSIAPTKNNCYPVPCVPIGIKKN